MSALRQIFAVTRMNLRNVPQRWGSSAVVIVGNAGVVAVFVSVLAMAVGFRHTINDTGRSDRVIVLRGGSNSELTSVLSRESELTISDAPGIKKDSADQPIVSGELVLIVSMQQKGSGNRANVTLRGLGEEAASLRPEIRIMEGRMFESGKREIVVGRAAQKQFSGLAVGNHVAFGDTDWEVVGAFTSSGDLHESEVFADVESVAGAYRRKSFNSVTALLDNANEFDAFKSVLTSDPTLTVEVMRETDYFAGLSQKLGKLLTLVGWLVGGIMSVGALFAALNSIYASVSSRRVEIATLRAMGFSSASVVVSIVMEALLLALAGGVVGALIAVVVFNGNVVNTLGTNDTQVVFRLTVTPALILIGLTITIAIGIIGGLMPAARAARLPVATALRAL